jgi:hypothetical protein
MKEKFVVWMEMWFTMMDCGSSKKYNDTERFVRCRDENRLVIVLLAP